MPHRKSLPLYAQQCAIGQTFSTIYTKSEALISWNIQDELRHLLNSPDLNQYTKNTTWL
jgi:predicted naringenin-chalcone synthase